MRIHPMEKRENETFHYTYSAKQQEEIKTIRERYAVPEEEDKMTRLRRLDASVTKKAAEAALVMGIVGALLLGCGMSLIMTDIGEMMGMQGLEVMLAGIIIGVIGIALVCCAYPIYNRILRKERKKIAPEIIMLTDELMK